MKKGITTTLEKQTGFQQHIFNSYALVPDDNTNMGNTYFCLKTNTVKEARNRGRYKAIDITYEGSLYVFSWHRIKFLLANKRFPFGSNPIDHINNDSKDNRISNLAEVSHRENISKGKMSHTKSSKHTNISFCKFTGKWRALITEGAKRRTIGRYPTEQQALEAYNERLTFNALNKPNVVEVNGYLILLSDM